MGIIYKISHAIIEPYENLAATASKTFEIFQDLIF